MRFIRRKGFSLYDPAQLVEHNKKAAKANQTILDSVKGLFIKLTTMCMRNTDTVASYLMNITELRDRLIAIGTKVEYEELVPIT